MKKIKFLFTLALLLMAVTDAQADSKTFSSFTNGWNNNTQSPVTVTCYAYNGSCELTQDYKNIVFSVSNGYSITSVSINHGTAGGNWTLSTTAGTLSKTYLQARSPQGTITLSNVNSQNVTIAGSVSGGGLFLFINQITVNYTPVTYSITYNNAVNGTDDVVNSNPTSYNVTSATFTLSNPTRTGYTFDGWYADAGFNTPANTSIAKGSTGNKTFYAKWIKNVVAHNGSDEIELTQDGDDYTATRLDLEDGKDFSAPVDFKASTFTYSRTNSNRWGTICLPVQLESDDNIQYYTAGAVDGSTLVLTPAETVAAGTPAVFQITSGLDSQNKGTVSVNLSDANVVSNASTQASQIELCGTFTEQSLEDEGLYYIASNKFWLKTAGTPLTVKPFRAWFRVLSDKNARERSLNIAVSDTFAENEEATSIADIDSVYSDGVEIFGTDGAKLEDMQKGVNIVKYSNGKTIKIIVK